VLAVFGKVEKYFSSSELAVRKVRYRFIVERELVKLLRASVMSLSLSNNVAYTLIVDEDTLTK
jgi:hypothetical protein